jgi:hypothetical protein
MGKFTKVFERIVIVLIVIFIVLIVLFIGFLKYYYDYSGHRILADESITKSEIKEEKEKEDFKKVIRKKIIKYLNKKYPKSGFELMNSELEEQNETDYLTVKIRFNEHDIEFNAYYNIKTNVYGDNFLKSTLNKYIINTDGIVHDNIIKDNSIFIAKSIDELKENYGSEINNKVLIEKFTSDIFQISNILSNNLDIKSIAIYYYYSFTKQQLIYGYDEGAEPVATIDTSIKKLDIKNVLKLIKYSKNFK